MRRLLPLLLCSLTLSHLCVRPAQAHLRNYLVNYGWNTLEKGRMEVEVFTDLNSPGSGADDFWSNKTEVEYGVTDRLTLAAVARFVEPLGYTSAALEGRYRFGEKDQWPVDVAGYLELKKANHHDDHNEIEAKVLLSKDIDKLNLVANIIGAYEEEIEPNGEKEWEFENGFTFGAAYKLGGKVTPGIEYVAIEGANQVIPGVYIDLTHDIRLNLGVSFGSGKAIDKVYKTMLELEF